MNTSASRSGNQSGELGGAKAQRFAGRESRNVFYMDDGVGCGDAV